MSHDGSNPVDRGPHNADKDDYIVRCPVPCQPQQPITYSIALVQWKIAVEESPWQYQSVYQLFTFVELAQVHVAQR